MRVLSQIGAGQFVHTTYTCILYLAKCVYVHNSKSYTGPYNQAIQKLYPDEHYTLKWKRLFWKQIVNTALLVFYINCGDERYLLKILPFVNHDHINHNQPTLWGSKLDNPMKSLWKVVLGQPCTVSGFERCSQSGPALTRADRSLGVFVLECQGRHWKSLLQPL